MTAADFWEQRYAQRPRIWSGRVNQALAEIASRLTPGRALDLGCGEGGDAIWLAQRGWHVTAVDISTTALARGREAAVAAGVPSGRIEWVAADLGGWEPSGAYDLVSACFLASPVELSRTQILRRAASAVAPAGSLLLISHAAPPPWASDHAGHAHSLGPAEEVAALGLDSGAWEVVLAEVRQRPATGPDGEQAVLSDTVVRARRRPTATPRDVAAELAALEPIFHRSAPGSARDAFEELVALDFSEVGASGRVYGREFVLDVVAGRYARGDADGPMRVDDFAVRQLSADVWLVTYALDQAGRASRRSTIWLDRPGGWVAAYHQGTLVTGSAPSQ